MKISYIAPVREFPTAMFAVDAMAEVVAEATRTYLPQLRSDVTAAVWLKGTIVEAINEALVEPFKAWFAIKVMLFMRFSYWVCFFTIAAGLICRACGIRKGKKVAIIAALSYVFLIAFYRVMSVGC